MQYPMEALIKEFSKQSDVACEMVVGSSGKLTAQIQEGAPFHIFVSADHKYPLELYHKERTIAAPEIYAYGHLVLWTTKAGVVPEVKALTSQNVAYIALPNPKIAPYGKATAEFLQKNNLWETVRQKLVYGESIAQTNQFIISGSADIGFTAKSVVLSPNLAQTGKWTVLDTDQYAPIAQAVVVLKNKSRFQTKAIQFQEFLFSKEAKEILENFGYSSAN